MFNRPIHAKFEISSFNHSKDMEGPKIIKVGHVTSPRPLLTCFWIFVVSAPHCYYSCQIWCFQLEPFPRFGGGPKII